MFSYAFTLLIALLTHPSSSLPLLLYHARGVACRSASATRSPGSALRPPCFRPPLPGTSASLGSWGRRLGTHLYNCPEHPCCLAKHPHLLCGGQDGEGWGLFMTLIPLLAKGVLHWMPDTPSWCSLCVVSRCMSDRRETDSSRGCRKAAGARGWRASGSAAAPEQWEALQERISQQ